MFYTKDSFFIIIFSLLLISVLHICALIFDTGTPLALLYGPLLFCAHIRLLERRPNVSIVLFLFLPFFLFFTWWVYFNANPIPFERLQENYYLLYFILTIFSLSVFPIIVLSQRLKWSQSVGYLKSIMIQQLSVISITISFFVAFLFMKRYIGLELNVPIGYVILMLLLLASSILFRYVYQASVWKRDVCIEKGELSQETLLNEKSYSLPIEVLESYAKRLHNSLMEDKLYLQPDLCIEILARETNIPKHHFSELFNAYLGKSFYQIIAEYRIKNAMDLLKKNGSSLTIEALAYESGFNSKTSFNRYFKQITGSSPSEFRDQQSA